MERDFKGIWIPKEIWLNKDLTMNEKLFLIEIDSLDNENGCFASNDYFSEFFGLSKSRCSEIIHALEKKGILSVILQYKSGSKAVEKRIIKVFDKSKGYSENRTDLFGKSKGYSEKAKDNNTPINNTLTNNTPIYIDLTFIDDVIEKVQITEEQYNKLLAKYNQSLLHSQIIALDNYIVNGKGNKYKDHYRALNTWCKDKGGNNNIGQFSKNTTTSKKYNLKREEFDASKYDTSQGDMPV